MVQFTFKFNKYPKTYFSRNSQQSEALPKLTPKKPKKADANVETERYFHELKIFNYWHDFIKNRLFGIEINDQIARVSKMNMILHNDCSRFFGEPTLLAQIA